MVQASLSSTIGLEIVARMRVPKMAKNGHNSFLHVSASAQEDSCSKESRTDIKPKAVRRPWKANKNHFRPISEQACARATMVKMKGASKRARAKVVRN